MVTIRVHGLGYVGLPVAALLANEGHDVAGYDIDEKRIRDLREGNVPVESEQLREFVRSAIDSGSLTPSSAVGPAECHIVCVPTPLGESNAADLSMVEQAADAVGEVLRPDDFVVLQSTVPPGTTSGVFRRRLEREGLRAGDDFGLAYVPETVLPGAILDELYENDRIVGGIDEDSRNAVAELYTSAVDGDVWLAPDPTTAEFVKLAQNAYRDANIAFANEMAKVARDYGVDSRTAIELANHHPRVDILDPGPGVGGHCLPVDPHFFGEGSDRLDLVERARAVNDGMAEYVVDVLAEEMSRLSEAAVAVLGIAYKGDVNDVRHSPGLSVARELQSRTSGDGRSPSVRLHDPMVDDHTLDLRPLDEALSDADAAVVTTDHSHYERLDPATVREAMDRPFVLDVKGVLDADAWAAEECTVTRL
ncbi:MULTISPECIES: nucleotide sugar dehydrogenase [Halorussus]|uniref:nucleotide sugar dehydrogenase n=1 Tax=Halorussus TaxID=1070314 RepID=UPI000E210EA8|nr:MULTISPECIES: nucleotide sugar dehydrogenase [Halorussus]NHN58577.1 nucleotide sugar dehydrogenase [Halorussus sp. JP-T4]